MSHKVNPLSEFFSSEFSWLFLLLYFAIVRSLESLCWLRRCTAQRTCSEKVSDCCSLAVLGPAWPVVGHGGDLEPDHQRPLWALPLGHLSSRDPHQPDGDFLRAALRPEALPTQLSPSLSLFTGSVLHRVLRALATYSCFPPLYHL